MKAPTINYMLTLLANVMLTNALAVLDFTTVSTEKFAQNKNTHLFKHTVVVLSF